MTTGFQETPHLRKVRPGAGFETGDFVEATLGGGYSRTAALCGFYVWSL